MTYSSYTLSWKDVSLIKFNSERKTFVRRKSNCQGGVLFKDLILADFQMAFTIGDATKGRSFRSLFLSLLYSFFFVCNSPIRKKSGQFELGLIDRISHAYFIAVLPPKLLLISEKICQ